MRIHACLRCDTALEERTIQIGERTHRVWVRVCCENTVGDGWYWRSVADPVPPDPDDIPDSALDWSTPQAS
jgi:hypothetical protein